MTSASLTKAGDVQINSVTIITSRGMSQDITAQAIGFDIYEDLFSPFMSGRLYVRDSQEITNLLPIIGEEVVDLSISTPELEPGREFKQQFVIYKMEDKKITSDREVIYTLHIISREAIIDMNQLVSRSLSGSVDEIANSIITSDWGLFSKKQANIEKTKNRTKFIANFWSPTKCLQYAAETAVSETGSPSFVFFENKYGLNFVPLDLLYDRPTMHVFIKDNYTAVINPSGGSTKSIEEDYRRILDIEQPVVFNYIERLKKGFYGSEIVYMDLLTGQYVHNAYTPDFSGKHLNPFPLYSSQAPARPKGCLIRDHQAYNAFTGFGSDTANTKINQQRHHLMAAAEASKVSIKVFGRTDYAAGQKVELRIPQSTQLTKEDPEWADKVTSGNYLISSICHSIDRKQYVCSMELIKDSYLIDVDEA